MLPHLSPGIGNSCSTRTFTRHCTIKQMQYIRDTACKLQAICLMLRCVAYSQLCSRCSGTSSLCSSAQNNTAFPTLNTSYTTPQCSIMAQAAHQIPKQACQQLHTTGWVFRLFRCMPLQMRRPIASSIMPPALVGHLGPGSARSTIRSVVSITVAPASIQWHDDSHNTKHTASQLRICIPLPVLFGC